jgi:hypothetical protein
MIDKGNKNYSDDGLYGRYATDYYKVIFEKDESTLTLEGDNNINIIFQF